MNQAGTRQGRTTSGGLGVGGVLSSARLILQTQGVAGLFAGVFQGVSEFFFFEGCPVAHVCLVARRFVLNICT